MSLWVLFGALLLTGLALVYFGVQYVSTFQGKAVLAAGFFLVSAGMVGFITMVKAQRMVKYYGALSRTVREQKEKEEG